jgi:hypothetical protein
VKTSPATNYDMTLLTVAQHSETEVFSSISVERQHLALNIQTLKIKFGTIKSRVHESIVSEQLIIIHALEEDKNYTYGAAIKIQSTKHHQHSLNSEDGGSKLLHNISKYAQIYSVTCQKTNLQSFS